jgi:hypothetical protein
MVMQLAEADNYKHGTDREHDAGGQEDKPPDSIHTLETQLLHASSLPYTRVQLRQPAWEVPE